MVHDVQSNAYTFCGDRLSGSRTSGAQDDEEPAPTQDHQTHRLLQRYASAVLCDDCL